MLRHVDQKMFGTRISKLFGPRFQICINFFLENSGQPLKVGWGPGSRDPQKWDPRKVGPTARKPGPIDVKAGPITKSGIQLLKVGPITKSGTQLLKPGPITKSGTHY